MKNYTYTREAIAEEIHDYELVEKLTAQFDDEEFSEIVDMLGEYFLNDGEARKAAYSKVYRFANKLGITVKALITGISPRSAKKQTFFFWTVKKNFFEKGLDKFKPLCYNTITG